MSLEPRDVKTIAYLARIRVAEEELSALAHELSSILGWVEQLNAVDTTDIAPMSSVMDLRPLIREDLVNDGGQRDAVLANAPEASEAFFSVPKVVE